MSIFKPVSLTFKGKEYTIPAENIMRCLAQIEDVITLQDISGSDRVPIVKVSQAYGIALRFAGAKVLDEEVYESVFEPEGAAVVGAAIQGLLTMMIPPSKFQESPIVSESDQKKPKKPRKN